LDLTLKFDTQKIVAAIGIPSDGEQQTLTLTGRSTQIPVECRASEKWCLLLQVGNRRVQRCPQNSTHEIRKTINKREMGPGKPSPGPIRGNNYSCCITCYELPNIAHTFLKSTSGKFFVQKPNYLISRLKHLYGSKYRLPRMKHGSDYLCFIHENQWLKGFHLSKKCLGTKEMITRPSDDGKIEKSISNKSITCGSPGLFMPAKDLAHWGHALFNGRVASDKLMNQHHDFLLR
jgi:hypothetical protein